MGRHPRLRWPRLYLLGVALIVVPLVAASCGSKTPATATVPATAKPTNTAVAATPTQGSAQPTATQVTAQPTAIATAVKPTPAPTATTAPPTATTAPVPAGQARLALPGLGNESLDPRMSSVFGKAYFDLLYDPFVGIDTIKGTLDTKTGVANSWQVGADGTTWTYDIRPGIKFHNGDELTATDVKFEVDNLRLPGVTAANAASINKEIKDVEVVNPTRLIIRTNFPTFTLPWDMSMLLGQEGNVVPKAYIDKVGYPEFAKKPVGSGPYKFVSQTLGSDIQLQAASSHWLLGVPKFQTVRFSIIPEESTRIAMLKSGATDFISLSRNATPDVKAAGFNLVGKPGTTSVTIIVHQMWHDNTPLKDPRVRMALNLAINKQEIKDFLFKGQGSFATLSYPMGTWNIGNQPMTPYAFDKEKAKQLLVEAGYGNGLTLNYYTAPETVLAEARDLTEAVVGYWKAIGVNAKVIPIEYGSYLDTWRAGGFQDPAVSTHAGANRPLIQPVLQAVYSSKGTYMKSFQGTPPAGAKIAPSIELDTMIDTLGKAADEKAYGSALVEIEKYFWDNNINLTLFETDEVYAASKALGEWNLGKAAQTLNLREMVRRK